MGTVKYSYSRLSTYGQCPWKYKLKYVDFNFVPVDSIAIDLGTLIHFLEEHISYALMNGEKPDYDKLIDDFSRSRTPICQFRCPEIQATLIRLAAKDKLVATSYKGL